MSGETHRDDDLEFNDDFVLEDVVDDLDTLFDDPPAAAGAAAGGQQGEPQTGEDQILFADTPAAADPNQSFTPPVRFTEQGGVHWKGFRMSPQEIGIPTGGAGGEERNPLESDPEADEAFGVDSGTELELVEDESQLMAAPADGEQDVEEATPYVIEDNEGQLPLGEAEAALGEEFAEAGVGQEAEDAWAPLPAEGLESGVAAEDGGQEGEAEEAEYTGELVGAAVGEADEQYYVDAPADRIGAPVRRRSMKWLTGLAAAVLMLGAGTAVFLQPEWFGLGSPALVERVQIARPRVELEVAPPEVVPAPGDTGPERTPEGRPEPAPSGKTDPTVTPEPGKDPGRTEPVRTPVPTGRADQVPDAGSTHLPLLPVNDIIIGGFDKGKSLHAEAQLPDIVKPLLPGVRAFVQLKNGNFFIGSVKAIDAQALTMRVGDKNDKGEIHLPVTDITRVASLGTTEYNDLLRATSGFIRLTNNNRLVGSILESVADDHVILEMKSNRILVPKSAIEEIGQNSSVTVGFAHGADEDQWVRRLAEQKLKDLNKRGRSPEEDKAPAPQPKGDDKPQVPTPR